MPTRAELLDPRRRTVYRNDPAQISRGLDPITGEEIAQYEERPPIRPSLEPVRTRSAALPGILSRMRPDPGGSALYPAPRPSLEVTPEERASGVLFKEPPGTFRPWGESFADITERQRRIAELNPQTALTRAQTAGAEAETAVRRRGLEPVELPGYGPVEREAIPFLTAREQLKAQTEERRRARGELTAYQKEQLDISRAREGRLAGTGKEGMSQAEARQLYGQILTEARLRLGPAALPDEVGPMLEIVAEEMGVDLEELNSIRRQGLAPLEIAQPNVGVSPALRVPLSPAREAILGRAKAAVAGGSDREKLVRAQIGQTVTLTDGRKVKKVGANAFETVE